MIVEFKNRKISVTINAAGINGGYIVVGPSSDYQAARHGVHEKIAGPFLTREEAENWVRNHQPIIHGGTYDGMTLDEVMAQRERFNRIVGE